MGILTDALKNKKTVAIVGHINPDGDCIGSCLGMYNYLTENFDHLEVSVFLEPMGRKFGYLKGYEQVNHVYDETKQFDLCITLDASDEGRLGAFAPYLQQAKDSLCVDHHITNKGMGRVNVIESSASSTCEVVYCLLEPERISRAVAECLYTGMVHDTGVFKYSCTSRRTMNIAGHLMELGIDFPAIIDNSFYMKSFDQLKLHGRALTDSVRILEDRCIYTVVTQEELREYGCTVKATDGIVEQLRVVDGVECAILLYETGKLLENAVSKALKILGYLQAENYNDGKLELDQVIVSPEGDRFIGECEGKDSTAINVDKFRQLNDSLYEDFQREEVLEKANGIIFGNPQRLSEPNKRTLTFTEKCINNARREKVGLVLTMDLFKAAKRVADTGDEEYARKCRQAIKEQLGEVVVFPEE